MSHSSVIVIDDEKSIRDVLKQLLELEGYEVFCYGDANAALNNLVATRVVAAYKFDAFQLGAIVQDSENLDGSKSGTGYLVSASYKAGSWVPKIQLGRDTSKLRHAEEATQWTFDTDYILDKQTNLYALVTQLDLESDDDTSIAVGMKYKF
ncbi:porin [Pseudoalteromonas sp. BZB3]|uniref:porin n=1 Tax=Pseudoalteromonas sp. BZB3 TaxID=3136670 RepID=UPI0032C40973